MNRPLDFLFARHARRRLLRQEHHAHTVLPRRRQRDAELAARAAEERIGQLKQDARAVALQRIRTRRAAMREVHQNLETLLDDGVTLASLDVRDKS